VGFEPTISAGERPQTHALDRAATGTGNLDRYVLQFNNTTTPDLPSTYYYITKPCVESLRAAIAQSVHRLATGWTARGSNPNEGEIFRTRPEGPWGPTSLLYNGYRLFPAGKAAGAWR